MPGCRITSWINCPRHTLCSLWLETTSFFSANIAECLAGSVLPFKTVYYCCWERSVGRQNVPSMPCGHDVLLTASLVYSAHGSQVCGQLGRRGEGVSCPSIFAQQFRHPLLTYPASISARQCLTLPLSPLWECVNQTHEKFLVRLPVEREDGVYVRAHVHKLEAN